MNQFYVSLIFIGIGLVVCSMVWILYDRKKAHDDVKALEEKKQELVDIINDAEQIVEELNRFSDYIVSQMDLKREELWKDLALFSEQVKLKTESLNAIKELKAAVNQGTVPVERQGAVPVERHDSGNSRTEHASRTGQATRNEQASGNEKVEKGRAIQKEKVIPINSKYKNVIHLAEKGMSSTEIAKNLNMGKGEVQLILELNR